MNIEEASLYLKHTSKDDFNLEEHQKVNRYEAIQVVLEEIERLNNIINELEKDLQSNIAYYDNLYEEQDEQEYIDKYFALKEVLDKLQELKGSE